MGGTTPGRTGSDAHRVGVIGAGFIGEVHARALRRAGARLVGVAASSPDTTDEAVARLGAERGFAAEELATSPDVDVVHICTPNHLHGPLALAALDGGQARGVREAARDDPTAAADSWPPPTGGRRRHGAVRLPLLPDGPRGAGPGRANGPLAVRLVARQLPAGLAVDRPGRQLARRSERPGPSRAFADIGSHWCDLVEFVTGDRLASVSAPSSSRRCPSTRTPDAHVPAFAAADGGTDGACGERSSTEDVALVLFRTVAA